MIKNTKKEIEKYILNHNSYLRKIISSNLKKWLSFEYSDIYNQVLYHLYKFLQERDLKKPDTKLIMGTYCKYWVLNINKSLEIQKHKILNQAILIKNDNYKHLGYVLHPIQKNINFKDIKLNEMLSLLNTLQKEIAKRFSDGYSQREIEKELNISRYFIKNEMKEIKKKIEPYLKKRDFL